MESSRYAFRKAWMRAAARLFDAVGAGLAGLRQIRPPSASAAPRRVLLLRLDHLGDGLFVGPALAALRAGLPDAELVLLCGPWGPALFGRDAPVNAVEVREVPWFARPRRRGGVRAWLEILRWIRRQRFDAAIDFRGDIRHLAWLALARIPVRLGYARTGGGFWLTHRVPYRDAHEVERNLDLVGALTPQAVAGPLLPVSVDTEARRAADALLAEAGSSADRPAVIFHLTAGYPSKCWEPESLAQAIDLVHESGLGPILVIGTAAEAPVIAAIVARARHAPSVLAGRTTLPQLVALLGRARGFVGHDSGPAHLAVAVGVPCVLLYSGVNALRSWGPWGGRTQVLHRDVECSPCGLAVCNRNHECMRDIAPQAVVAALRRLVDVRSGSPP